MSEQNSHPNNMTHQPPLPEVPWNNDETEEVEPETTLLPYAILVTHRCVICQKPFQFHTMKVKGWPLHCPECYIHIWQAWHPGRKPPGDKVTYCLLCADPIFFKEVPPELCKECAKSLHRPSLKSPQNGEGPK